MAAKDTAREVGRRAAGHPWFHLLSRAGLAARGLLYLLIGWLALLIAAGHGGKEADKQGALRAIADRPGGWAVLCLLAAGFAGLALWQFAEALYGRPLPQGRRKRMRLPAAFRGLTYVAGCVGTIGFLFGLGHTSSDQQSRALSARAMAEPGGRWAVLREVYLPFVTAWMLGNLKVAVGFAFTGAVVGEFVAATRGLGYLLSFAQSTYNAALMLALVLLIMIFVLLIFGLAGQLERRLLRWRG